MAQNEFLDLLRLTLSPVELMVRGTLMFWFLFFIFRFVLRRDVGAVGVSDFLFLVILGDAAQNAMSGNGTSVGDGMLLIVTLALWNYSIDALSHHVPAIDRLTSPRKLCLVRDGRMRRRQMRREFVTTEELEAKLREHQTTNIDDHILVDADVEALDGIFVDEDDRIVSRLGAKGVGEIGMIGVAAALCNAIRPATGRRVRNLPMTPNKLMAPD